MLSPEKIHYFIEVGRNDPLSNAAKKMNVAVSTVPKAITDLEHDMNKRLLARSKSGIELTKTGKLFYESTIDSFIRLIIIIILSNRPELQNKTR
jgi:Transcriptional regulator